MIKKYLILCIACLFVQLNTAAASPTSPSMWKALSQSFKLPDQSSHPVVKAQIRWLIKHPGYLREFAQNATPYIYYVLETIKQQHLPGELALLPMIESNYNPFAYSKAGASGLWQLMPGTSSGLGVKQNWWYDGRRGIISSTTAALDYLTYLAKLFKSNWILAIAAYDSGEGTVQRAIRYNIARQERTNFWSLKLPHETQAYLPRLLALASVIKYPRYFGIQLPESTYAPYFREVEVGTQIDLTHAAKLAHMKYEQLLKLNPGHNRWATAPNRKHTLLIPYPNIAIFKANLEKMPKNKRVTWKHHRIKSGESLSVIALREKSNIRLIKKINHLKNDRIKEGHTLLIPRAKKLHLSRAETKRIQVIKKTNQIGPHKIIHIVKRHDTFARLEKRYRVKAAAIRFWNQFKANQTLKAGDKLIIWQSSRKPRGRLVVVKKGDNLGYIAHRYHVKIADIKNWNPKLKKQKFIHPKQKLIIYA